ncbi:MAG: response regulator [Bacteroidales bacterium]|jgi:signal transduction histidine kinase|nr:response regulator [Bacteroidales bacterium]
MENLNVMVVDDEPGIRSGVSRILRNFTVSYPFMDADIGFNLIEVGTGEEAIEKIKTEKIEIVLLDNKLPGIHGTEVLEYININNPDILVMMITSYASLELAVKATNNGAYDFIPKPFTPQELKSALENVSKHLFLRGMTTKMNKEGKEVRYQFLSVLSHELKAPLNAIEGYLRIMQEKQAGEEIASYDQMIDRSLHRIKGMRNLIMDLLDLTKINLEKKTDKFQNVDIGEIAQLAIESINPYAIQKDVKITLINDKNITLNADPSDLEIVFNNLISNAVKYNVDGGKVKVTLKSENKNIKIVVEDSGIGLSKEETDDLFKEFFRVKNEQTKHITGSGLGLSIVKRVVDLYNGDVKIESKVGVGSTFVVTLPI